jgi:hypothetical protein
MAYESGLERQGLQGRFIEVATLLSVLRPESDHIQHAMLGQEPN